MLAEPLLSRDLTSAFAQVLRDHIADQDSPLATLDGLSRTISALLARQREQAAAVAAPAFDELAIALHAAVTRVWAEHGGEPYALPRASGASH